MNDDTIHILTVGWDREVIKQLTDRVQAMGGFRFSHIVDPPLDRRTVGSNPPSHFYFVRDDIHAPLPRGSRETLAELEQPGVRTIHNMILGDVVTKMLKYEDALDYASFLAGRYEELFLQIKPSIVLGGFDGLHSGIAMAVARKLELPWFALQFPVLPTGIVGFCSTMSPESTFSCLPLSDKELRALAEQTLDEFESRRLVVPAYISANTFGMIARRIPHHAQMFYQSIRRLVTGRYDKYTDFPVVWLAKEYVRKRINLLSLPRRSFVTTPPPNTPYVFFGLHMQPEMAIDVWAPFFANQFAVIEHIARSTPPTHQVLVKIHKSDADNYSPGYLKRLRGLPGVRIVSPYVSSREFIENASLVFGIQGTLALEAAMLGRPVLFFGDSKFVELPSVTKVKRVTDLPQQVRAKLAESRPDRESIIRGLMSYLGSYAPGCYNDWGRTLSEAEVRAMANNLRGLREFVRARETAALFSKASATV